MKRTVICVECKVSFEGQHNSQYCNKCNANRKKVYKERAKERYMKKRAKKTGQSELGIIEKKAREAGMTYGKYVAIKLKSEVEKHESERAN